MYDEQRMNPIELCRGKTDDILMLNTTCQAVCCMEVMERFGDDRETQALKQIKMLIPRQIQDNF